MSDTPFLIGRPIGRAKSYIIITIIYIMSIALGIGVYCALTAAVWLRLLLADVAATVLTFAFGLLMRNASVYDPYWSVQPPVILACVLIGRGAPITLPHVVMLATVSLWAVRLTANWAYTFGGPSHQDWRYTMPPERCGRAYPLINFIGIHMVPTLVVFACIMPAVYVCLSAEPLKPLALIGTAISLLAVGLQTVSDIQMHRYRKNRTTPFIRCGLWRYSRHPNYLGEILMWWGVALFAVLSHGVWWGFFIGALLNTALFLFVSIPMADGRQARKDGFADYKRETRMLLPFSRR